MRSDVRDGHIKGCLGTLWVQTCPEQDLIKCGLNYAKMWIVDMLKD